jgi:hypothetical protein
MGAHGEKNDQPLFLHGLNDHPAWLAQKVAFEHIPSCHVIRVKEPGIRLQQDSFDEMRLDFRAFI